MAEIRPKLTITFYDLILGLNFVLNYGRNTAETSLYCYGLNWLNLVIYYDLIYKGLNYLQLLFSRHNWLCRIGPNLFAMRRTRLQAHIIVKCSSLTC